MSWNVVLNKFIEIKERFIGEFGESSLWNYKDITCIEYWVEKLENKEYENMISCLKFTESNDLLMFRYYYLERAVKNGIVKSVEELWNVYDGFYSECRSVVINIKENELVLTPFKKFHNINAVSWTKEDVIAEKIKQSKHVEISTKLDGSMQSARWYKGKVVVAGSKGIDRKKAYRVDCSYQIIESNESYKQMLQDYNEYTAIFEYIFLNDVHVVKYNKEEEGLYLVGMRSVATGEELSYKETIEIAKKYNIPSTSIIDKSYEEVMSSLDDKKSYEAEGFVLNVDGLKVKIKYNDFVMMHHVVSQLVSPNVIIKNIADDTWDDLYSKIPEQYRKRTDEVAQKTYALIDKYTNHVNYYVSALRKHNLSKKEAMLWIRQNVPKMYEPYVRETYLGKECNFIKNRNGKYLKLNEIEALL